MPLPGTRVIHRDWSPHHRPTAEGGMTAIGTITRASTLPPMRDEETGQLTPAAPTTVAARHVCRVQALPVSQRVVEVGEVSVTLHTYLVAVPGSLAARVHVGDTVTVDECDADPAFIGRQLLVKSVTYGSELWQRDLVCEDDMAADHG